MPGGDLYKTLPALSAALAQTYDATISSSTEITLNASTQYIVVTAIDKPIFMKWGTDNVTNANFDYCMPQDTMQIFKVPDGVTAVNFLQQAATAILAVVEY